MTGRARRIGDPGRAVAINLRSPALRRAQLSFGAMWAGEWAVLVVVGVVAFRAGGTEAVGAVAVLRMLPAALVAPFAATLADTGRRERVLAWVGAIRAVTLGAAALVLALDGPAGAVYGLVVPATIVQTLYRPAHSALLPALCGSPAELTAANLVRGLLDSLATLLGPLLAAALLAAGGPALALAACAALSACGGALVVRLPYEPPPRAPAPPLRPAAAVAGIRALARDRALATITALTTIQTFTRGALSVFAVVVAIDLLDAGDAGVGLLNAAVGAGAVAGSLLALALLGPGRLATTFGLGVALWGLPLAGIGALPGLAAALALLAVVGVGNALVDVGAFTLPARLADESVLARVFAGFEGVLTLGAAAGAACAPAAIDLLGVRGALVAVGLLGPLATLAAWPALHRLDARMRVRDADIDLLQRVPMLRPLPEATLEQLAASLGRAEYEPGAMVFAQGDAGDRWYVVEHGAAEVLRDATLVGSLGRGEGFGEIALLRDAPRTATVRAARCGPLAVASLGRERFLTAVAGYSASAAAGEQVVADRLGELARLGPGPRR
jgi:Cyclic nucleotide-binding domain/Major Facilitator Superfamily